MTYKDLLHLVTFKEVEPHIVNMYPPDFVTQKTRIF